MSPSAIPLSGSSLPRPFRTRVSSRSPARPSSSRRWSRRIRDPSVNKRPARSIAFASWPHVPGQLCRVRSVSASPSRRRSFLQDVFANRRMKTLPAARCPPCDRAAAASRSTRRSIDRKVLAEVARLHMADRLRLVAAISRTSAGACACLRAARTRAPGARAGFGLACRAPCRRSRRETASAVSKPRSAHPLPLRRP